MKAEKPTIPRCAPEGTRWTGGPIEWFRITLKVKSEDIVPDEVSRFFGCEPDVSQQKDKPILRDDGTVKRVPKFGYWNMVISPEDTDEWDCCEAAMALLDRLPTDIDSWLSVSSKYPVGIVFALSMDSSNKGFSFSNQFLKYVGDRGINLEFDIYHEED